MSKGKEFPPRVELLPCPFCGHKAKPFRSTSSTVCMISCGVCKCSTQAHNTEAEARETWNRRAEHSHLLAEARSQARAEALRHLGYLRNAWNHYREVGKEKMAIVKMQAPLFKAMAALGDEDAMKWEAELQASMAKAAEGVSDE